MAESLPGYDKWLEAPYQKGDAEDDFESFKDWLSDQDALELLREEEVFWKNLKEVEPNEGEDPYDAEERIFEGKDGLTLLDWLEPKGEEAAFNWWVDNNYSDM